MKVTLLIAAFIMVVTAVPNISMAQQQQIITTCTPLTCPLGTPPPVVLMPSGPPIKYTK